MKHIGENVLALIVSEAMCGVFPSLSAIGNPESISESVPQAKADLQNDEDEHSETIELLTAKFRT
jgi:hypothetical protein